jgi:ornithine carbamoyltransferase
MGAETAPRPRSYLRVLDLSDIDLRGLLELAARMKENPGGWETTLRSETLSSLFEKPSTRTRVSFEAAAHRLGMLPVMLRPTSCSSRAANRSPTPPGCCPRTVRRS